MTTTIRLHRETKQKLEEIGRKGQSFDDIINNCIIEYCNNQLYEEHYFALRVEGEMNLQYGKISIPKKISGKKVKDVDLLDDYGYLLEQMGCELEE